MFHFHRTFKAAVGETVVEFIRRLRLDKGANTYSLVALLMSLLLALETGFFMWLTYESRGSMAL